MFSTPGLLVVNPGGVLVDLDVPGVQKVFHLLQVTLRQETDQTLFRSHPALHLDPEGTTEDPGFQMFPEGQ